MKIAMLGLRAIGQEQSPAELDGNAGITNQESFLDLFSGIEKAVEEISVRLADRGHDVTVFCRGRYNPDNLDSFKGVSLRNLPAIYTKHLEAITHTFLAAMKTLKDYDIVHFHATGPSLLSFLPRLTGKKVVATVHGLDWQREKWRGPAKSVLRAGAWAAGRFPHRTIVVSKYLQKYYLDVYKRRTEYIPNGITPEQRIDMNLIKRFGVEGDDFVLFLGRIVPEKGCHLLIESYRKVKTDKKLLIVGGSSYSSKYVTSLRHLAGGDDRIVFTGALHGREKTEVYSNASLLVMPSTLEGMPIVMLEAMSFGCPVLCSDIPEHMEIVRGENGDQDVYADTFKSGSAEDLAAKLIQCLKSPQKARQRAEKAREYVGKTFSWDRITDLTENVYTSLVTDVSLGHQPSTINH